MDAVILTGVSGQLGQVISKQLLDNGFDVIGLDISHTENLDPRVEFCNVDITSRSSISNSLSKFEGRNVISLINNAGTAVFTPFEDRTEDEIQYVVNVNMVAPILMTQEFIKYSHRDWRSSIINFGSIYGIVAPDPSIYGDTPRSSSEIYGMTKAANINLTLYLASYLKKYKIRANCISPGGVKFQQGPNFISQYSQKVPMQRMAFDNEIASAVNFLVDWRQSGYINGHNLVVDGGLTSCI